MLLVMILPFILHLKSIPEPVRDNVVFAVSPNGSDSGPGTTSQPFKTFDRLDKALADRPSGQAAEVHLSGTFYLDHPVKFGTEASKVTFEGPATITGAWVQTSWKQDKLGSISTWSSQLPAKRPVRGVWEDDKRLDRPSLPDKGFYRFGGFVSDADKKARWSTGQGSMLYRAGDLNPNWRNLQDVEIVAHHRWTTSRLPIKSLDPSTSTVQFDRKSVIQLSDDKTLDPAVYKIENVAEALKSGEFYLDLPTSTLHVIDKPDKPVYVPHLDQLVSVENAHDTRFTGIRFSYTDYNIPPTKIGDVLAAISVPSALAIKNSTGVEVSDCDFIHLGGYGLEIMNQSSQDKVLRCHFDDLGAGGVKIGSGTDASTVADCTIERGGRTFSGADGIWVGDSANNKIVYNRLHDLYYTGISVGWVFGYGPSKAINNLVEGNDVSEIGRGSLSDMGGIYMLGVSPGTIVRGNRIRDVQSRGYGGWGIYLDEGSSNMLVEDNIVLNTSTGGLHQHYGKDNTIRNNVFAYAERDGQIIRSKVEDHLSFTFENNVVVWKGTPLLGGDWSKMEAEFKNNQFWRTDEKFHLPNGIDDSNIVKNPKLTSDGQPEDASAISFQKLPTHFGPR